MILASTHNVANRILSTRTCVSKMLSPRSSTLNRNAQVIGVAVPENAERSTLPVLHPVMPQVLSPPGKKQSPISVKPPDWLTLTCANVVCPVGVVIKALKESSNSDPTNSG